ncbi:hypothetical protein [Streptacidiphilus sp. PAMC 29251]
MQDLSWTEGDRTYDFWISAPTGDIAANRYYQIVSSTFHTGR